MSRFFVVACIIAISGAGFGCADGGNETPMYMLDGMYCTALEDGSFSCVDEVPQLNSDEQDVWCPAETHITPRFMVSHEGSSWIVETKSGSHFPTGTIIYLSGEKNFVPGGHIKRAEWTVTNPDGQIVVRTAGDTKLELKLCGTYNIELRVGDSERMCDPEKAVFIATCESDEVATDEVVVVVSEDVHEAASPVIQASYKLPGATGELATLKDGDTIPIGSFLLFDGTASVQVDEKNLYYYWTISADTPNLGVDHYFLSKEEKQQSEVGLYADRCGTYTAKLQVHNLYDPAWTPPIATITFKVECL